MKVSVFKLLCSGCCMKVTVFWLLCSGYCVLVTVFQSLCFSNHQELHGAIFHDDVMKTKTKQKSLVLFSKPFYKNHPLHKFS